MLAHTVVGSTGPRLAALLLRSPRDALREATTTPHVSLLLLARAPPLLLLLLLLMLLLLLLPPRRITAPWACRSARGLEGSVPVRQAPAVALLHRKGLAPTQALPPRTRATRPRHRAKLLPRSLQARLQIVMGAGAQASCECHAAVANRLVCAEALLVPVARTFRHQWRRQ
jgi:hypothetical protein